MDEYFTDRKGRFAKDGFASLEDFIVQYGMDHYSTDLRHFISWSSNRSIYDSRVDYDILENTLLECWYKIRSALYSGALKSFTVDGGGNEEEVPSKFWGSEYADDVLKDGKIRYIGGITDQYSGRITIGSSNGTLFDRHSNTINIDVVEAITSDRAAKYSYHPLGYINVSDAFDCILKAKLSKARMAGTLNGSFAMQKSKIDKIEDAVEREMMDKFERGVIIPYHYESDIIEEIEKLRKVPATQFRSLVKNENEFVYPQTGKEINITDKHRWRYEVIIRVDNMAIEGKLVVGIEDLSSSYPEDEIEILNNNSEFTSKTVTVQASNTNASHPVETKNNRGRPLKYDKDVFMWEAIKVLIWEKGPFPTEEAHSARAAERYVAAGGRNGKPSDSWSNIEIKELWKKIDVEANRHKWKSLK